MTDKRTLRRVDGPGVMIIGKTAEAPPDWLEGLDVEAYEVSLVERALDASTEMAEVMPLVVVITPAVPMTDHRTIHDAAVAVGANVLIVPDDAHPAIVQAEVEEAMAKAAKKRAR
jgi:hypothetical protein